MAQNAPHPVSIQIASVPDRDELVAEIWDADDLLAEVCIQEDRAQVEIYPRRDHAPSVILQAAVDKLRSR